MCCSPVPSDPLGSRCRLQGRAGIAVIGTHPSGAQWGAFSSGSRRRWTPQPWWNPSRRASRCSLPLCPAVPGAGEPGSPVPAPCPSCCQRGASQLGGVGNSAGAFPFILTVPPLYWVITAHSEGDSVCWKQINCLFPVMFEVFWDLSQVLKISEVCIAALLGTPEV